MEIKKWLVILCEKSEPCAVSTPSTLSPYVKPRSVSKDLTEIHGLNMCFCRNCIDLLFHNSHYYREVCPNYLDDVHLILTLLLLFSHWLSCKYSSLNILSPNAHTLDMRLCNITMLQNFPPTHHPAPAFSCLSPFN